MIQTFEERRGLMTDLFPWDDANFGLDEEWVRFYRYTSEVAAGGRVELQVMLRNHSAHPQEFRVTPHVPAGWSAPKGPLRVTVPPRQERPVAIPVKAGSAGLKIVTADVAFGPWDLREWAEAMVVAK